MKYSNYEILINKTNQTINIKLDSCSLWAWKLNKVNYKTEFKQHGLNDKPAVYILQDRFNKQLYIGETEALGNRFNSHFRNNEKSWVHSIIVILSKEIDSTLNQEKRTYYEKTLIHELENQKLLKVINTQKQKSKNISQMKKSRYNDEYNYIKNLLSFLNPYFNFLLPTHTSSNNNQTIFNNNVIKCYALVNKKPIKATYNFKTKQTIISEGQTYYLKKCDSDSERQIKKWNDIYNDTLLKAKAGQLKIVNSNPPYKINILKDIAFDSSSAAASFLKGRGCDGLADWKNNDGIKLNEIMSRFSNDDTPKDKKN